MKTPPIPPSETERLAALRRYGVLDTPAEAAFDALTRLAAHLLKVPIALVSLVDADRQWFKARYGIDVTETPRDVSFCGHAVASERLLIVEDASADDRFADNPLVAGPTGIRFYAGQPLTTPDGHMLGTLCVIDRQPRKLDDEEREMLRLLAAQAMDQLARRRENRLLADREARLKAVLDTAVDVIVTIDERGVIERVNPAAEQMLGYTPEELTGQDVGVLASAPHGDRHAVYVRDYLRTGVGGVVGCSRQVSVVRKDGTRFPAEVSVSEQRLDDEVRFTGILRDVTERHDAMARLREAKEAIEGNARNLEALLDLLDLGTVMLDAEGRVEFINARAQSLLGLDPAAAVGRPAAETMPGGITLVGRLEAIMAEPPQRRIRLPLLVDTPARHQLVEIEVRDDPRDERRRILFVHDVSELQDLRSATNRAATGRMVGAGPAMAEVVRAIHDVAAGDWSVLIEGETGTGKELAARAIHAASRRREGRFVALNCGGLTESLLSSQLFGHRRGAFTGAVADQEGVFEAAAGGTLLLDEIGEIPLPIQAHLLRVLQEKEIVRVGETRPRRVDARIVAATNRDLEDETRTGRFRQDLLYRIRVARIHLPPLRERPEDVPLLVETFLAEARLHAGKAVRMVSPEAMQALTAHSWPGNIRELKSAIDHALIHCRGDVIEARDLPREVGATQVPWTRPPVQAPEPPPTVVALTGRLHEILAAEQRVRILDALRDSRGDRQEAARLLGMSRATFYRRLKALGMTGGDGG